MKLQIKNMVCDRCIRVVREEFDKMNIPFKKVTLGEVDTTMELQAEQLEMIRTILQQNGFALLTDRKDMIIEQIKTLIIEEVQYFKGAKPEAMNFSDYLSEKTGYDYSYISSLFSAEAGLTIEQYIIAQKIEKIKEWLSYDEMQIAEMAWKLAYSSPAHLSNQFKKYTGMTPGQFKKHAHSKRTTLDQVGTIYHLK
jgi:AraC family transcriptional regulator